jgi:hypothetical protein
MVGQPTVLSPVSVCRGPDRGHLHAWHLNDARCLWLMARGGIYTGGMMYMHNRHRHKKRMTVSRVVYVPVPRDHRAMRSDCVLSGKGGRRGRRAWRRILLILNTLGPGPLSRFVLCSCISTRNTPRWGARVLLVCVLHQSALLYGLCHGNILPRPSELQCA